MASLGSIPKNVGGVEQRFDFFRALALQRQHVIHSRFFLANPANAILTQLHHTGAFLDRHSDYMAAHPPSVSSSCMLVKELPRSFAAPPDDNEDNPASDGTPPDELSSDALGYPTPPPLDFTEREREAVVGLLPAGPWVRGTDELRAFDEAVRSLAALNLRTAPVLARLPRQVGIPMDAFL